MKGPNHFQINRNYNYPWRYELYIFLSFQFLKSLKQKKYEIKISIKYGDMGI